MTVRAFPQRRSTHSFASAQPPSTIFRMPTARVVTSSSVVSLPSTAVPSVISLPSTVAPSNEDNGTISRLEPRIAALELALPALEDRIEQQEYSDTEYDDAPGFSFDPGIYINRPRISRRFPNSRPTYPRAPSIRKRKTAPSPVNGASPFSIFGVSPEIRFVNVAETDPAGRYRFQAISTSGFLLSRPNAAGWTSMQDLIVYDRSATNWLFNALESNSWYIRLLAGAAATAQTNAEVAIGGSTASKTGVRLSTGDGTGSLIERLAVLIGAASVDIDVNSAVFDFNGNATKGFASTRGNGTADFNIIANKAPTDAIARRIAFWVLNPANDTEYNVANGVPHSATPFWTQIAPDDTPTTSELDDEHITFTYVKATNTLSVHRNEGGAIVSLALGVLA